MRNLSSKPMRRALAIVAVMGAIASSSSHTSARRFEAPADEPGDSRAGGLLDAYARLPIAFVENRGQTDPEVRYYAQGARYSFYLTQRAIVLSFLDRRDGDPRALPLQVRGGNPAAAVEGEARASGAVNSFQGNDPRQWRTDIARYSQVVYRDLWKGVDLRLRDQSGSLKYEFLVHAGARLSDIRFAYAGAKGLSIDDSGALRIETAMGPLRDAPPVSHQLVDGVRVPVESRYELISSADGEQQYGFDIGAGYRPDRDLVIDPGIEYSTLLGGSGDDVATGIKVDAAGNAYIVGWTQSPDFPTTAGAFRRTGSASNSLDVFVSKLNATGSALVYSTFIGGTNFDWGRGIAIDAAGNAYVTGQTKSSNFPTTGGAFDRTFNVDTCPRCGIDQEDAFVLKLNPTGSALVYSTFLGGFDLDDGMAIAVDGAGNAYVAGETGSTNFPVTAGAFDTTRNAAFDTFVSKLNATGSALVYSTFLGGSAVEYPRRIAVDAAGNAYVGGTTSSTDFPTTPGAFDTTHNGSFDAYVTKLAANGGSLVYSTFLGGLGSDGVTGLVVDATGSVYVSGGTGSVDFPTTPGAFDTLPDGSDGFVTRLNAAGSALVFSTVIGGSSSDSAAGLALDGAGNIWITGGTTSSDFPIIVGAVDSSLNGGGDAFIAQLSGDGSTLLYSTFIGGQDSDGGSDIAIDSAGDVYIIGHTSSLDFPTTTGALDTVFNGNTSIFWGDAFVVKLATDASTSTPPSTPPTPAAPALLSPAVGESVPQPFTFDWSDVVGAASYTLQVDTASDFAAPLVRNESLVASNFTTNGIAAGTYFWRVRAVNVAGVAGAWSATRSFVAQAPPPLPTLSTFSTNPSTVVGGNASSGTVVLSTSAQTGGAVISLSSSNPNVASVPATATAAENSFTATFMIATAAVAANTTITITAAYNGTTRTATLTVTPPTPAPPAAALQSVTLNPASVAGGSASQGTVTLSSGAPAGGATVTLSSSGATASVPASVTVAAGATQAFFITSTASVTASTAVTISASYNGVVQTAGLTVTSAPPPPQTVTLTVSATGRSGERISSSPAGISVAVGSSGQASFTPGTSVTLTVSNGRDAIWSGACSSGGSKTKSCTLTVSAAASVTANVQ